MLLINQFATSEQTVRLKRGEIISKPIFPTHNYIAAKSYEFPPKIIVLQHSYE